MGSAENTAGHPVNRHQALWDRRRPLIEEYCRLGMSLAKMGKLLGSHGSHIHREIRRWGISYQPYSLAGENNPAWKGGIQIDTDGYVLVYSPDHPDRNSHNKIRLHRLVMEKKLGRRLLPSEVVHHVDKNKLNNSPENLVLYSSNGKHLSDELDGKCPNWTAEGWRRMGNRLRGAERRSGPRASTQSSSASQPEQETGDPAVP